MQARHCSDEAEAKSVTGRTAAAFKPIEALEHVLTFGGGNSRSIIGDWNHRTTGAFTDLLDHSTSLAPVFDRVLHEIADGVE